EAMAGWLSSISPSTATIAGALSISPGFMMTEAAARILGPYDTPFAENPLAPIAEAFRYDHVCARAGPDFFVCATNVRSGKIRVFSGDEITPAALLASACLPTLFRAVEIEDPETGRTEAYWDGGYSGNPALYPLFRPHLPADIVIVNINPLYREEVPRTVRDIADRVNEISFNSSLMRELRAIAFVSRLIGQGALHRGEMREVLVHKIADDGLMTQLSVATKILPNPVILDRLRQAGRAAGEAFLAAHLDDLNERSSVDMQALYG
ncbi:MAG: patatin-like phospholipase family protein, partial [Rhodobacteraceae bacterium]|nr:patatin-like phospholipase family protein [Paracoccaceae bacterium]